MGDENTTLSAAEARHLLRRTGFGAAKRDVDEFTNVTRGAAADALLRFALKPRRFKPTGADFFYSHNRWIKHLLKTRTPLQSKLALFWHDHFATGISKVQDVTVMAKQVETIYLRGAGSMVDFVKAMNIDPAMMEWLDTVRNRKQVPNENYARELQELFTLGVNDFAGNANYTQDDIVQIARAFTGWTYEGPGKAVFDPEGNRHDYMADYPARGPKVIFTQTGGFGPGGADFTAAYGEGAGEVDAVTEIIFQHTDTNGRNTVARRAALRLLEYFAHPDPDPAVADAVVTASGFDTTFNIAALMRAILVHDAFYESGAPAPFGAATKKSVKWPVDYMVSTMRLLGVRFAGRYTVLEGGEYQTAFTHLENMGQLLLDPPSVFGWDWETAWISSATLLARYGFARDVTTARESGSSGFRSERIRYGSGYLVDLTDPATIVDAVTDILGVDDQITASERDVLIDYVSDNGANPTLDLHDYDVRNSKLHGLFALVLQSPAYQLQ